MRASCTGGCFLAGLRLLVRLAERLLSPSLVELLLSSDLQLHSGSEQRNEYDAHVEHELYDEPDEEDEDDDGDEDDAQDERLLDVVDRSPDGRRAVERDLGLDGR